ncbi:MAG TPA: hypothetical protein PKA00_21135, partial [Saprospiraceae bacterium]|nr:hypothetical protein [Saprospiraceae bacterium]
GIRKMLKKGFEPAIIADVLEVSESFVLEIQQQSGKEAEISAAIQSGNFDEVAIARQFEVYPLLVRVIENK